LKSKAQDLPNGLDDIGSTLSKAEKVRNYECRRKQQEPWLFTEIDADFI